jgi:hypothetical protein
VSSPLTRVIPRPESPGRSAPRGRCLRNPDHRRLVARRETEERQPGRASPAADLCLACHHSLVSPDWNGQVESASGISRDSRSPQNDCRHARSAVQKTAACVAVDGRISGFCLTRRAASRPGRGSCSRSTCHKYVHRRGRDGFNQWYRSADPPSSLRLAREGVSTTRRCRA